MRFLHMNRWGQSIGDGQLHDVTTAEREQGTDGTDTLTITTSTPLDQGDIIAYKDTAGKWREHTVTSPEQIHDGGTPYWQATAHTILNELSLKGIDRYKQTTGPQAALEYALADTRFSVGKVESNGVTTGALDLKQTNALDMLQQIANTFDLEIDETCEPNADMTAIEHRTVSLLAAAGTTLDRRIEWGRDLKGVRVTTNSRRPITRLYVYGKAKAGADDNGAGDDHVTIESVNNGRKYIDVEDQNLLKLYGRPGPNGEMLPSEGFIEYDSDDPATLLRLGKGQLTKWSQPAVTYEIDAIQLAKAGMDATGIGKGDTIQVVDRLFPVPLRLSARVSKIKENLLGSADDTTLTFGDVAPTLTRANRNVQNTVQQLWSSSGLWDDAANLTGPYLDGVINGLNGKMNATGGYTYLKPNEGLWVYDKPLRADGSDADASMVIQIGGGYFRIANSRKSDGTWNWRTMGTGAGLVADVIVAGILKGGSSYFNLNTGEINFTSGIIHNSSNTVSINLNTGEVILEKGRITDNAGNEWDLNGGGGISITDGTIRISGYVDGKWTTTTIDASGFHVTGAGGDAGTMTDNNGNVGLRGNTLGPDDDNYLKVGDGNAMKLVAAGDELFTIQGSQSYSSMFRASALGNRPFLEVGDDPQGQSGSTVIHTASGDDYPCIGISPSASYMLLNGNAYIVASDSGWANVHGIEVGNHGYEIYATDNSIQMLTPSHHARIDLTNTYSAIVYDNYHVMVSADGVGTVTKATTASTANANVLDTKLMALADDGLDLDSPEAYEQTPVGIEEIDLGKLHDVLRLLVDGKQAEAKTLLDQYEGEQKVWTQADYDRMNIPTPPASLSLK